MSKRVIVGNGMDAAGAGTRELEVVRGIEASASFAKLSPRRTCLFEQYASATSLF